MAVSVNYAPTLAERPGPSPEALALQQAYAKQLLQGTGQPIGHWSQGVAGIVDALVGGTIARRAGEAQSKGQASAADQFAGLLMAPEQTPPEPPAAGDMIGAVTAGMPQPTQGISREQITALLKNPFASDAQKKMAIELWQAQNAPPKPPEAYTLKPGESRFVGSEKIASVPDEPGDQWEPISQPDPQGRVILRNKRNGDMKVGIDTDVRSDASMAQELKLREAGATKIENNIGQDGRVLPDPEKGYAWKLDQNGKVVINKDGAPVQVPIGGGSIETEAKAIASGEAANKKEKAGYTDITINTIDRILEQVEAHPSQTTGPIGALQAAIGVGYGNDTAKLLSSIESVAALDKLQSMREAARAAGAVGSGLGQVTAPELELLKNSIIALNQNQSPAQFKQNLRIFREVYKAIVTRGIKPGDPLINEVSRPQGGQPSREDIEAELKRRGLMK